jgi:hypothetical protein
MPLTLSPLHSCDVSAAHAVYNRAFDWLNNKGVRQWLLRVDETVFATRQAAGEAFAIHVDGALAGAVFVALETIPYYTDALKITPQWWMHTLVTRVCGATHRCAGGGAGVCAGAVARWRFAVAALRERCQLRGADAELLRKVGLR